MGSSHSHTNVLDRDNTVVRVTENAAEVCWGESNSNRIQMMKSADKSGKFPSWSMAYTICSNTCYFTLETSQDSVLLHLQDSADNPHQLLLKIKRDGCGGLECEQQIWSHIIRQLHSINNYQNFIIETEISSYCWSQREGLFVVEKRKNGKNENPYLVTLAHCYVTHDIGLSVVADVRNRWNDFWVIEVKGPYMHPAKDLLKVLDETYTKRLWSPAACSHCCPTQQQQPNHGVPSFFRRFLNVLSSNQSNITKGESMNYLGLVNNPGNIQGLLNGSVVVGGVTIQGK